MSRGLVRTRNRVVALVAASALAIGLVAAPAASAQNVSANNLVSVQVVDAVDLNSNIFVPIGIAANVAACVNPNVDVTAAVLAQDLRDGDQETTCTISEQDAENNLPRGVFRQNLSN